MASSAAGLELTGIEKRYGQTVAVAGLDLSVGEGEFVTLLGPSGCGKTTTLGLVAGFFPPTRGEIRIRGNSVEDLPPFRRDTGVVFQDYALFPHMTVTENIAFGLKMRKTPQAEAAARIAEAIDLVQLGGLGERRPLQLSGGQRQRVALARALVIRPSVLLLDEPLSNLDLKLREEMRVEIAALQRQLGITTVFVTHDQSEALVMSDRIAVMNAGRIEQIGTSTEIYEHPATRFVAEFIGSTNLYPGEVVAGAGPGQIARIQTAAGDFLAVTPRRLAIGERIDVTVRPERASVATEPAGGGVTAIAATVRQVIYLGSRTEVRVGLPGEAQAIIDEKNDGHRAAFVAGQSVYLVVRPEDVWLLPHASGGPSR